MSVYVCIYYVVNVCVYYLVSECICLYLLCSPKFDLPMIGQPSGGTSASPQVGFNKNVTPRRPLDQVTCFKVCSFSK